MRPRRPSAALLVALLALFVALGGPAQAARLVTGGQVKDHSLQAKDLSRKAVRSLRKTPASSVNTRALRNGAVSNAKLANGAVTAAKLAPATIGGTQLAPGAVGNAQVGDGAITGAKIADATLDSRDVARFSGRFRVTIPGVPRDKCWSAEPVGLAPEAAGADISGDLVLVTPDASWPEDELAFTVRNSARRDRFVLAACNTTQTDVPVTEVGFRYAVIDLP
jgi:hypothetical protein